jgi:hypothetical protein
MESLGASLAMGVVDTMKAFDGSPETKNEPAPANSDIPELWRGPTTPTMGPAGKAPPVAKLEPANSARSAQKHAAAPSKGAGGSQLQAAPVKKAAGAQGSSAFKKLVLAAVVLVLVVLGAVLFASKAPNSAVAGTVQTCASKLGVDINDVGKKVTDMGKKVGQSTGASALLAKLPSQQKPDLSQSEEGGGLVQSVAYAAGAAITSTVGYGVYWLMTQGWGTLERFRS